MQTHSGYITIKEAASTLKVDQSTVRRWIRQGILRGIRIGSTTLRVDLSSLRFESIGAAA